MADFAFAMCLPGLEPAVKRDVARVQPGLRLAYSRPGLLTFKADGPEASEIASPTPFARLWGRALGPARTADDAARYLASIGAQRLHVFARDPAAIVDLAAWHDAIAAQLAIPSGAAVAGELVGDVIVAAGEPAWVGSHRAAHGMPPHPGAAIPVDLAADAPSRAFAKIEEAIAWAELPIAPGHVALEIGAAPGGAMLALARRGVEVWGVDTADIAAHVLAEPRVHHLRHKVGAVRWEQLPPRVDWLLLDVNLAPQVALHEVARLMLRLRTTLYGAVFTLKLNDWSFVDVLPDLVARIHAMGFASVRLRHLPSNRREITAVALRP